MLGGGAGCDKSPGAGRLSIPCGGVTGTLRTVGVGCGGGTFAFVAGPRSTVPGAAVDMFVAGTFSVIALEVVTLFEAAASLAAVFGIVVLGVPVFTVAALGIAGFGIAASGITLLEVAAFGPLSVRFAADFSSLPLPFSAAEPSGAFAFGAAVFAVVLFATVAPAGPLPARSVLSVVAACSAPATFLSATGAFFFRRASLLVCTRFLFRICFRHRGQHIFHRRSKPQ